jgi:hypothetical protein
LILAWQTAPRWSRHCHIRLPEAPDGTVDINDTNILGRFIGKKLPPQVLA